MNITLYNNTSPPNKIVKTLSGTPWEITNVRFTDDNALSVISPKLILDIGTEVDKLAKYNYLRIPKFSRYYYFEVAETSGGLAVIHCKSDPLMSFSSDILNPNGPEQYITRSEAGSLHNRKIVDTMLPMYSDKKWDVVPFGENIFITNCANVILETIGKGGTPS